MWYCTAIAQLHNYIGLLTELPKWWLYQGSKSSAQIDEMHNVILNTLYIATPFSTFSPNIFLMDFIMSRKVAVNDVIRRISGPLAMLA